MSKKNKWCYWALALCAGLVILYILYPSEPSQYVTNKVVVEEAYPITTDVLYDTEWISMDEPEGRTWTIRFTRDMLIDVSHSRKNGKTHVDSGYYYLSDIVPAKFDNSKVGKKTKGRYIVLYDYGVLGYYKITDLGLSEMTLKPSNGGNEIHFRRK